MVTAVARVLAVEPLGQTLTPARPTYGGDHSLPSAGVARVKQGGVIRSWAERISSIPAGHFQLHRCSAPCCAATTFPSQRWRGSLGRCLMPIRRCRSPGLREMDEGSARRSNGRAAPICWAPAGLALLLTAFAPTGCVYTVDEPGAKNRHPHASRRAHLVLARHGAGLVVTVIVWWPPGRCVALTRLMPTSCSGNSADRSAKLAGGPPPFSQSPRRLFLPAHRATSRSLVVLRRIILRLWSSVSGLFVGPRPRPTTHQRAETRDQRRTVPRAVLAAAGLSVAASSLHRKKETRLPQTRPSGPLRVDVAVMTRPRLTMRDSAAAPRESFARAKRSELPAGGGRQPAGYLSEAALRRGAIVFVMPHSGAVEGKEACFTSSADYGGDLRRCRSASGVFRRSTTRRQRESICAIAASIMAHRRLRHARERQGPDLNRDFIKVEPPSARARRPARLAGPGRRRRLPRPRVASRLSPDLCAQPQPNTTRDDCLRP